MILYKRIGLYKHYRMLIPVTFRDIFCPKPPKWVFDHVEKDKKRKKEGKKRKLEDEKAIVDVKK